jgi:hypothetical protein
MTEQLMNRILNKLFFHCKDSEAYECPGDCYKCDWYVVSRQDVEETLKKMSNS